MTPGEWAEVFRAGWDDSGIVKHEPAGDAVAKALRAMELKCREIASAGPGPAGNDAPFPG